MSRSVAALLAVGLLGAGAQSAAAQQAGTTLTASVSATAHNETTFKWTIDKQVTPATWNLFRGDSGTSQYTVSVTKDAGTTAVFVDGVVCVTNGGAVATQNLAIQGVLTQPPSTTALATFTVDVSTHPILAPGETFCYAYGPVTIPSPVPGATYKVTANVTITNHSGHLATPFGPSPSASTVLPATPTLINDSISVNDSVQGPLGTFSASGSASYTRTYTCDADQGTHPNTATISPASASASPSASASVTVNCFALGVTKDASTSFTRTFHWTIDKQVTPATWNLFRGDSGTSQYTVSVTKDAGTDSDFAVSGTITIANPAPIPATVNSVSDVVSPAIAAAVTCPGTFPATLAPGGTLVCSYSASLPDALSRTNTATATLQNHSFAPDGTPTDTGTTDFSGTAAVTFGSPTTLVNDSITVDDSVQGPLGTFSASGSASYTRTYTCDADQGTHPNTATISPASASASPSASASVTVNCFALGVTKTANTSFTRTFHWTIQKSATLVGSTINYSVTLTHDAGTDSDFAVSGTITIANPAPIPATVNSVSDVVSPAIAAAVTCPGTFPATLAPGGTLVCSYSASLPDALSRTNTATATLQNHSFAPDLTPTNGGTTNFSGTAAVDFSTATINQVDETVTVTDSMQGLLGTATVGLDPNPKTFTYSRAVSSSSGSCGSQTVTNTATFTANDTGATGSATATVTVRVQCNALSIGFWKNHASCTTPPASLDQTLASAEPAGIKIGNLTLHGSTATPNVAPDCQKAVRLLSKQDLNGANKASDPAFGLAAQLLGAKLDVQADSLGIVGVTAPILSCQAALNAISQGQALLVAINFNGLTHSALTAAQTAQANSLATTLAGYATDNATQTTCS